MNPTEQAPPFAALEPFDEDNRELAAHVHPSDWVNPKPAHRYHLVVVGGGTAGLVSAAGAAGLGARVALVERALLGGDCLNVGCVPSKAVLAAAREWKRVADAGAYGLAGGSGGGDFGAVMRRMRKLRSSIAPHDGAARFRDLGIDVFLGHGRFVSPGAIEVGDARLAFHRAVIATGARAATLPLPGFDDPAVLTNETVFSLETLPARLAVVGAGPIGCELAQAFARFGSQVTLLDAAPRVLPREDADAAAVVGAELARDGVRYLPSVALQRAERRGDALSIVYSAGDEAEQTIEADRVLVAIGRKPNVDGMNLNVAGVDFDDRTGVRVDKGLRTTGRRIYAAGDVASSQQFTHAADAMARIVIQNALFYGRARADRLVIPRTTYTSPELAQVGLTEDDAAAAGVAVDVVQIPMADVDRCILEGRTLGFAKILVERGRDRIVGATVVADDAGDLVAPVVLAMTNGIGLGKIAATIHAYPTRAEVVKKAADAWRRTKLTPTVRALFSRYFRWLG